MALTVEAIPLRFGVCWDQFTDKKIDLDLTASIFDGYGCVVDASYFNNPIAMGGAVNHSGDRKDGVADGEDEFIVVDLAALPPFVTGLALSVHCFGSESFLAVETGSIHLSDVATGVRLSSQSVNGNQHTAVILYTIVRSPEGGSWLVTPAKTWCNGRTFMDILPLLQTEMHVDPVIAKECAGRVPVFNLAKGDSYTLPGNMQRIRMGLGWDSQCDLDSGVIMMNSDFSSHEVIYFGNKTSKCGSIVHNGDNTTGIGSGDDETINIDLSKVPQSVAYLFLVVSVYSTGRTFSDVEGEYCRLYEVQPNNATREVAAIRSLDSGTKNGFVFAAVFRDPAKAGWWRFLTVGLGGDGRTNSALVPLCARYARENLTGNSIPSRTVAASASVPSLTSQAASSSTSVQQTPRHVSPSSNRVRIEVLAGKQLLACDVGGSSDPYVKLYYPATDKHSLSKSVHVAKTLAPTWNFSHDLVLRNWEPSGRQVGIRIFDHDKFSKDDPMGEVLLTIPTPDTDTASQVLLDEWLPVQQGGTGSLHVRVTLL